MANKKVSPVVATPERRKGGRPMKRIGGTWFYQGKRFDSLHDALVSVWPK